MEVKTCKNGHTHINVPCWKCENDRIKSDMHKRKIEWNRSSDSTIHIEERIEKKMNDIEWQKNIMRGINHPNPKTQARIEKTGIEEKEKQIERMKEKIRKRSI